MMELSSMDILDGVSPPFFFIIDYKAEKTLVFPANNPAMPPALFDLSGVRNFKPSERSGRAGITGISPVPFKDYRERFLHVQEELAAGNSWLANLTWSTPLSLEGDLSSVFHAARSRYKVFLAGAFVSFSPEPFVRIEDGEIRAFPMKGTIDASIPDAERILLADEKEMAEHVTIVDLLRNDLGRVAKDVRVERFRYVEQVRTRDRILLQTSSAICGTLSPGWQKRLSTLLAALLPAGSVTGAPKAKTVEILGRWETHERGFYTGIAGYFDGDILDTCVLIRYIEKTDSGYVYKSGGGITIYSQAEKEYQEMLDKIYVPLS